LAVVVLAGVAEVAAVAAVAAARAQIHHQRPPTTSSKAVVGLNFGSWKYSAPCCGRRVHSRASCFRMCDGVVCKMILMVWVVAAVAAVVAAVVATAVAAVAAAAAPGTNCAAMGGLHLPRREVLRCCLLHRRRLLHAFPR